MTNNNEVTVMQADEAYKLMLEFYLSDYYLPKAERPADNVQAAIAFILAQHRTRNDSVDALRKAFDDIQQAEAEYRLMHDRHGDGAKATGRAWDLMRRAGEKARAALSQPAGEG